MTANRAAATTGGPSWPTGGPPPPTAYRLAGPLGEGWPARHRLPPTGWPATHDVTEQVRPAHDVAAPVLPATGTPRWPWRAIGVVGGGNGA